MNTPCVVIYIYVLQHKSVCMINTGYVELIKPFSLNENMEGFYAGVINEFALDE